MEFGAGCAAKIAFIPLGMSEAKILHAMIAEASAQNKLVTSQFFLRHPDIIAGRLGRHDVMLFNGYSFNYDLPPSKRP